VIEAAEESAERLGVKVSVSVVDARGDLIASVRMDGAPFFTSDVSRGKATASAVFGQPSAALADHAGSPVFTSLNIMLQGRLVLTQGAVVVIKGGDVVEGAVGVSGGTAQQDEDIANAGLQVL
jgi:uncharacterized protein GlcG (DUF336 family)